ncbi:MAG TPA: tetratricopeptide repeat protein [Candidatus Deferrimicrobium sp.]|nr:tetratricopeptide repeat protein [Candidatus Deferrimicrobium sp.]
MTHLFGMAFRNVALQERLSARLSTAALICVFCVLLPHSLCAEEVKPPIVEALNAGDTARAIEQLEQEIELDKGYHMNYYTLGLIYFKRMQYARATEQFQLALERKSKHLESMYQLGLCYWKLDQIDSAEALMKEGRAKAKEGMKHLFENGYGLVMLKKGDYRAADLAFRQALVDHPDNPEYLINLGDANFYQGVPSLAITYYEKALELDTGSTEVFYHWAEACIATRDYNCAIDKLQVVLSRDSTYANAWMRAGGIYFKAGISSTTRNDRQGHFKNAIGSYKRFLELSPVQPDSSNVRVFFELAMSYVNIGGYEDAVRYFDQVLAIPYEPKDIYFHYGKALWGIQEFEKSSAMLVKHVEWVKQQGEGYSSSVSEAELNQLLGDSYFYRKPKDYAAAVPYYVKSLETDPNQKRVLGNVAIGYHSLKSYQQAMDNYDKRIALGIDSANASILKNAGFCALNLAGAAASIDEDEVLEPESNPGQSTDTAIGANKNFYQEAVDHMVAYLAYSPSDTNVLAMVANVYVYQLVDCDNGVKYYQSVLALDPKHCEAKKALGFAYFGNLCTRNYTKAVGYLLDAYSCLSSGKGGPCGDVSLLLWIGQCYHLRAAEKTKANEDANGDYKSAYEWYEKCLKCSPSNADCKKGRDDVYLEFGE